MTDPTAALQRLGLAKYEAAVFVALQRVDSATASDVAELADVPRSQVYGAAEDLAERGLVDVQHGSPKRYRAVSLSAARDQLRRDFEREHERAFEALEELEAGGPAHEKRQEEIWTIAGRATIDARVCGFLADASTDVSYGAKPELFDEQVVDALVETADRVPTTVVGVDAAVLERFVDTSVEAVELPAAFDREGWPNGRFLVVDDRTVLLSVIGPDGEESAFWSSDTDFADVLIHLMDGYFGPNVAL